MGRGIRKPIELALSVLPIFMLTGCSSATTEEQQDTTPGVVQLYGQSEGFGTRGSLMLQASKLSTSVQMGCLAYNTTDDTQRNTTPFYFDIDDNQHFSTATGSEILKYPLLEKYMYLCTWIPYKSDTQYTSNASNVQFTIQTDQSTDANYLASDLLYGKSASFNSTSTSNIIHYQHLLSRLDIYLTVGSGVSISDLRGADVYICGVKPTIDFSLADGSLGTASGDAVNVKAFTVSSTASSASDLQASIYFPPQTLSKGSLYLMIKLGSSSVKTYLSKDNVFETKTYYTYNYEITSDAVDIGAGVKAFKIVEITGSATEQ